MKWSKKMRFLFIRYSMYTSFVFDILSYTRSANKISHCFYPLMMLHVNTFHQNVILSLMFSRMCKKHTVHGYITVIILFTFPK